MSELTTGDVVFSSVGGRCCILQRTTASATSNDSTMRQCLSAPCADEPDHLIGTSMGREFTYAKKDSRCMTNQNGKSSM